jgi:hypothetical protein
MYLTEDNSKGRHKMNETMLNAMIREQARVIAYQAQAIADADGTIIGPIHAAACRLFRNAETLVAWTAQEGNKNALHDDQ